MSARSADLGAHAVLRPVLVAARGRAEVHAAGDRRRSTRARSGTHERAADRIAHHLHAALGDARAAARRAASAPSMMPSTSAPERARDDDDEHDDSRTTRSIISSRLLCRRRSGMRRLQAVERALRRLAFRAVGRDLRAPAARPASRRRDPACRTPGRCRRSAASWRASDRASANASNCASALSG